MFYDIVQVIPNEDYTVYVYFEDGKIVSTQIVDTNGQGHGALSGFLSQGEVDVLICGGIGGGAAGGGHGPVLSAAGHSAP